MKIRLLSRIANRIKPILNACIQVGGSFFCPVCQRAVRRFRPLAPSFQSNWTKYGFDLPLSRMETINLEQYSCPLCDVSDRDRLFALYFSTIASDLLRRKAPRFIEFAPIGSLTLRLRQLFGPVVEYRTADLLVPNADDRVDICDMRACYENESVDALLCSHILEHVSDDLKALRELYRILRPGGWAVLLAPIHHDLVSSREGGQNMTEAERWHWFGQDDHVRLHSKSDFENRIKDAGFHLETLGSNFFGLDQFKLCGISPHSVLYIGRK